MSLVDLTADIVSAYVSNNLVSATDLADLIASVYYSLTGAALLPKQEPAVDPERSVFPDHIICLEDGKKFMSLKRHLMTDHGLTPKQYRAKWNLPADHPMVAPNYAERRSALAKALGFQPKAAANPAKKAPSGA
ncbi:MucR family transcriptional regulator [Mesorhizobium sp. WSM3860]|uniref:MucR family transcriptional regulator n=1 Tax=Mesorhizobium sp. WSM3860 TaxID=2029403 RepID=UPI000BAEAF10|nr:MucR family transcriptional regulator [Mesorhizobium sp. WSM3860]PBC00501.1 transcriptional regulator [Mesorhizobium sp. WSM3860]